jgi:hypothetical protein
MKYRLPFALKVLKQNAPRRVHTTEQNVGTDDRSVASDRRPGHVRRKNLGSVYGQLAADSSISEVDCSSAFQPL